VIANSRRGGRRLGALALRLGAVATPAFAALPDEAPGEVLAAFLTLAPADQQILSLVVWEELTPAEAAEALSMPVARFSVRLHRAKRRLRKRVASPTQENNDPIAEVR